MAKPTLLQALLYPRTVALIGASANATRLTSRPQRFLQQLGFKGKVYPVNPGRDEVLGIKSWASIADIPEPVDHAYILLDADAAMQAARECAVAGVPVVSVLADGFAEAGEAGAARQRDLVRIARAADMTIIGPNSTGVVNSGTGFACTTNAAFAVEQLPTGSFVVLSQSGSMTGAIASRGEAVGLGFKAYVSVGNEATTGIGELGEALVADSSVDGFVLFLETIRNPDAFSRFAHAANAAGKPIVAYLVGRSEAGQALAVSHTGAMVGGARALRAFLDANGVLLADGFEAMIEMTGALSVRQRLKSRPRVATVVTTTGGGGGMVYDLIGEQGGLLQSMSDAARNQLQAQGIEIKPGPLIDLTLAGTRYDTMKAVISALIEDEASGLVVAAIGSSAQFNPELSVRPIVDAVAQASATAAPVVAIPIPHAPQSLRLWNAGGVPAFRTPESCAQGVSALLRLRNDAMPVVETKVDADLPPACRQLLDAAPPGVMNEVDAGEVMRALGLRLPPRLHLKVADGMPESVDFDGPWVLKVISADIAHKSDVGGVTTDICSIDALLQARQAMDKVVATRASGALIDGYLVQQQIQSQAEVIVGLTRDPVVGPMISVGMGGVLTEIYQDISMHPAPVGRQAAHQMIAGVKGFAALKGYRGAPAADLEALAVVITALSSLANHPRVLEAEANPVLLGQVGEGATLVDALIRLS
ncbi:MAG: acetate--CoA ligase family protein [Burkholderiaceae bacterium]